MSYGGYNNNPYGGNGGGRGYGSDPFDDRNAMQAGGHEMSSFNQGQQGYGSPQQGFGGSPRPQNQNSILDECTAIQNGVQEVEAKLTELGALQRRALDDADTSSASASKQRVDNLTQSVMDQYRTLTVRLKTVKSNPECRNPRNVAQVNKTDRDLRRAIQRFQELEAGSRKEMQGRMERQARIAHPDASDAEIAQIVNSDTQIFQQAVMGNRAEQANRVLGAVKQRHQEMLQIERSLMELLDLLNDMQELLTKQEVTVMEIDANAQQAQEDMVQANVQLEAAVTTARKTRKKKWICLGICVTIVIIIVVAVVAYIMVNRAANGGGGNNNNNNSGSTTTTSSSATSTTTHAAARRGLFQRSVLDDLQMNTARAAEISADIAPTRRRLNGARDFRIPSNQEVEDAAKKRFVIDWEGVDSKGSDD